MLPSFKLSWHTLPASPSLPPTWLESTTAMPVRNCNIQYFSFGLTYLTFAATSTINCPSASWNPARPDSLCNVSTCVVACNTLRFFCDLEKNNHKWLEVSETLILQHPTHWRFVNRPSLSGCQSAKILDIGGSRSFLYTFYDTFSSIGC